MRRDRDINETDLFAANYASRTAVFSAPLPLLTTGWFAR
jgi:hypothetical protein